MGLRNALRASAGVGSFAFGLASAFAQSGGGQMLGLWARGDGNAVVRIEPCGRDLCAINTWIKPGARDERVGDKLVMTLKPSGRGSWKGEAFDPQRNLRYALRVDAGGETMTTSGCFLLGIVCKDMHWTRIGSATD